MVSLVDSPALRTLSYFLVAMVGLAVWRIEREASPRIDLLPPFWLATGLLILALGLARVSGFADLATDIGRDQARSEGLYEARRPLQALLVAVIACGWLAVTGLAIWRVPERRRRYLPSMLVVVALLAFAAVRAISLHAVDTVLYRADLGGVRGVTFVELSLLAMLAAASIVCAATTARQARLSRGTSH